MTEKEKESLVVTIPQAGRLLGLSRGTAYLLANQGVIPCLRLGNKRLVVPLAALQRLLDQAGKPPAKQVADG